MAAQNPYSGERANNPHGEDPFIGDPMGGLGDFQNPYNPLADEYQDQFGAGAAGHQGNPNVPGYPTGMGSYGPHTQGGSPYGGQSYGPAHGGHASGGPAHSSSFYGGQMQGMPPQYGAGNYPAYPGYSHGVQQGFHAENAEPKSWAVAALLAFFLGSLGVHNFYLNYTTRAKWQLGLTIFGWATAIVLIGIPFIFAVQIWAFVEFILILTKSGPYDSDGDGNDLR
ncbi:hypothetical protein cu1914 [Corynebacterium urealyticum DSM 7109]|uniref:TM2 domain-containing protein n=2 Tax=Corynebacterium urealyticum TaxID=43771 RepID=B1VIS7_CORU7|nr:NINE protein [Corynebacterium urealyticum]CAQ05873.1 hypothetical protein cu1914 [Corynebacterium urealyticum DSM 7109]SNV91818.1 TM2 domain [Corynebacterium urealyticum]